MTFVVTGVNFFNGGDGDNVIAEVDGLKSLNVDLWKSSNRNVTTSQHPGIKCSEDLLRQSVLNALIEEAAATHIHENCLSV